MKVALYILSTTRKRIVQIIESYGKEDLLKVPEGFKNSLIWNAAHCAVTSNLLIYKLSGLTPPIEDRIIDLYRKGTIAPTELSDSDIEEIKSLLSKGVEKLESDLQAGIFKEYQAYETSFGVNLTNIEEAILFNNTHEGLHLGYMMAMRKHL